MPRLRSQTRVTGMGIPLPPDLVGRCIESLPFEEVHTDVKQVSKEVRSAARRCLTRGRWRPVKLFCEQGLAALSGDAPPSSDETKAMLRSAWATDPSVVLLELASWPAMRPVRPFEGEFHANYLDATIRFLDVVEPSLDGIGRVIAPKKARRKLHDVLRPYAWQEWTRRHIEVPCTTKPAPGRVVYPVGRAALSPLSMRDEFILKRARALWSRSFKFTAGYKPIWSWRRRFEGNELRNPQPSCDRENDFLDGNSVEHRHASRGQLATPARSGGKKRAGGRKS